MSGRAGLVSTLAAALALALAGTARAQSEPPPPGPAPLEPGQAPPTPKKVDEIACGDDCSERPKGSRAGDEKKSAYPMSGLDRYAAGLRLSTTRVRGADRDVDGWGLTFAGRGDSYMTQNGLSGRATHAYAIGGGSAGFEGALELGMAFGARAPVSEHQGPFGRVGAYGSLWGNKLLYSSMLELPQVQVGWQFLDASALVEIGGRTGAVLTGRYNAGDDSSRKLGSSFEWGGYAAVHVPGVRFDVSFMRIEAGQNGPGGQVDIGRGALCALPGPLSICVDGSYLRGEVEPGPRGTPHLARSLQAGLLLGWVVQPKQE